MLPDQIKNFREVITLKDGVYVLLRPLDKDDRKRLEELFHPLSDEDLRIFRSNVKDAEVVQAWCKDLNYDEVLPVLALVKDRAVGLGNPALLPWVAASHRRSPHFPCQGFPPARPGYKAGEGDDRTGAQTRITLLDRRSACRPDESYSRLRAIGL